MFDHTNKINISGKSTTLSQLHICSSYSRENMAIFCSLLIKIRTRQINIHWTKFPWPNPSHHFVSANLQRCMGIWTQHGASLSPMASGIKECLLLCVSECYIRCMSSMHDGVYKKHLHFHFLLSCFLYSIISLHVSNPKNISWIYFFHSFTLWSIFSCIHSQISFLSCVVKNLSFPHGTLTPLGIPNHGTIELTIPHHSSQTQTVLLPHMHGLQTLVCRARGISISSDIEQLIFQDSHGTDRFFEAGGRKDTISWHTWMISKYKTSYNDTLETYTNYLLSK